MIIGFTTPLVQCIINESETGKRGTVEVFFMPHQCRVKGEFPQYPSERTLHG